jgi:large subunit ribosomal protein L22
MKVTSKARYVRSTPRKLRLLLPTVEGLPAEAALQQLRLRPQAAAKPLAKVIKSAMADAEHNYSLDKSTLVIEQAQADEGPRLKRYNPVSRGRAHTILRRTAHLTVVLRDEPKEGKPSRVKRAASKVKKVAGKAKPTLKRKDPGQSVGSVRDDRATKETAMPEGSQQVKQVAPRKSSRSTGRAGGKGA